MSNKYVWVKEHKNSTKIGARDKGSLMISWAWNQDFLIFKYLLIKSKGNMSILKFFLAWNTCLKGSLAKKAADACDTNAYESAW